MLFPINKCSSLTLCVCVCLLMCAGSCEWGHMHVEVRGQHQVSLFGCCPPCLLTWGLLLGLGFTDWLVCLATEPQELPVPASLQLGLQT